MKTILIAVMMVLLTACDDTNIRLDITWYSLSLGLVGMSLWTLFRVRQADNRGW